MQVLAAVNTPLFSYFVCGCACVCVCVCVCVEREVGGGGGGGGWGGGGEGSLLFPYDISADPDANFKSPFFPPKYMFKKTKP